MGLPNIVDKTWHNKLATEDNINKNYEAAANYYQQRKDMFLEYWSKKLGQDIKKELDNAFKKVNEDIKKELEDFTDQWWASYDFNHAQLDAGLIDYQTFLSQTQTDFENSAIWKKIMSYSPTLQKLSGANWLTNEGVFYQQRGFVLEDITANKQNAFNLTKYLNNFTDSQIWALLVQLKTNTTDALGMRSTSAITTQANSLLPKTRADNLIYPSSLQIDNTFNSKISNDNGKTWHSLEFMYSAEIDNTKTDFQKMVDDGKLMNAYLDLQQLAGVGGISEKSFSWKTFMLDNKKGEKKFMTSSVLRAQLNKNLSEANYGRGFLTQDWVDLYTLYFLSKQILQIVSPVTIALQTSTEFVWMHEVLSSIYFRMKNKHLEREGVDKNGKKKHDYGDFTGKGNNLSKTWYRYTISSDIVYMHNRARQNALWYKRVKQNLWDTGMVKTTVSIKKT